MTFRIVLEVTQDVKERLEADISGQGGFQGLLLKLQTQLMGNELTLYRDDLKKLARYATRYGAGGFQNRLAGLLRDVVQVLKGIVG